jgi:hypothetical protein
VFKNPANTIGPEARLGTARFDVDSTPVDWLVVEKPEVRGSLKTPVRTLQSSTLKTVLRTDARRYWVRGSEDWLLSIPPAIAVCPGFKLSL